MRALLVAAALLAACAPVPPPPPQPSLIQLAGAALQVGRSTKAEVRAALGEATVVDFASGYEVWVYREQSPEAELVLLFEPSGTLAKTRVRYNPHPT